MRARKTVFWVHAIILVAFSCATLLAAPPGLLAEDSATTFFKPDYVNQTKQDRRGDLVPSGAPEIAGSETAGHKLPRGKQSKANNASQATETAKGGVAASEKAEPQENDRLQGEKLLAVGVVFDATDRRHELIVLRELLFVARRYNLPISEVYGVGFTWPKEEPQGELSSILRALAFRKATPRSAAEPPQEYAVKESPAWILQTASGRVILEGVASLKRYLNTRGEFIAPDMLEQPQHAEPKQLGQF